MARLIDADKFAEKFTGQYEFMKRVIEEEPTVDAVEVVRCKDCKYYDEYKECSGIPIYGNSGGCGFLSTEPDDYCSYGERKE